MNIFNCPIPECEYLYKKIMNPKKKYRNDVEDFYIIPDKFGNTGEINEQPLQFESPLNVKVESKKQDFWD